MPYGKHTVMPFVGKHRVGKHRVGKHSTAPFDRCRLVSEGKKLTREKGKKKESWTEPNNKLVPFMGAISSDVGYYTPKILLLTIESVPTCPILFLFTHGMH